MLIPPNYQFNNSSNSVIIKRKTKELRWLKLWPSVIVVYFHLAVVFSVIKIFLTFPSIVLCLGVVFSAIFSAIKSKHYRCTLFHPRTREFTVHLPHHPLIMLLMSHLPPGGRVPVQTWLKVTGHLGWRPGGHGSAVKRSQGSLVPHVKTLDLS